MRNVILYIASSKDNFIARENGAVDWLNDFDPLIERAGMDLGYEELMERIDTILMGRKTYTEVLSFGIPWPYKGKRSVVFSRERHEKTADVEFSDDPAGFTRALKEDTGKDIWLVGGAEINSILLEAGLIDEMILTIVPVMLTSGIPLFSEKKHRKEMKDWEPVETKSFPSEIYQQRFTF